MGGGRNSGRDRVRIRDSGRFRFRDRVRWQRQVRGSEQCDVLASKHGHTGVVHVGSV